MTEMMKTIIIISFLNFHSSPRWLFIIYFIYFFNFEYTSTFLNNERKISKNNEIKVKENLLFGKKNQRFELENNDYASGYFRKINLNRLKVEQLRY